MWVEPIGNVPVPSSAFAPQADLGFYDFPNGAYSQQMPPLQIVGSVMAFPGAQEVPAEIPGAASYIPPMLARGDSVISHVPPPDPSGDPGSPRSPQLVPRVLPSSVSLPLMPTTATSSGRGAAHAPRAISPAPESIFPRLGKGIGRAGSPLLARSRGPVASLASPVLRGASQLQAYATPAAAARPSTSHAAGLRPANCYGYSSARVDSGQSMVAPRVSATVGGVQAGGGPGSLSSYSYPPARPTPTQGWASPRAPARINGVASHGSLGSLSCYGSPSPSVNVAHLSPNPSASPRMLAIGPAGSPSPLGCYGYPAGAATNSHLGLTTPQYTHHASIVASSQPATQVVNGAEMPSQQLAMQEVAAAADIAPSIVPPQQGAVAGFASYAFPYQAQVALEVPSSNIPPSLASRNPPLQLQPGTVSVASYIPPPQQTPGAASVASYIPPPQQTPGVASVASYIPPPQQTVGVDPMASYVPPPQPPAGISSVASYNPSAQPAEVVAQVPPPFMLTQVPAGSVLPPFQPLPAETHTMPPGMTMQPAVAAAAPAAHARVVEQGTMVQAIPDPASIEIQKRQYTQSLDAQLEQGAQSLRDQNRQQKLLLLEAARNQKEQLGMQVDQQTRVLELEVDEQTSLALATLKREALHQRAILEQQAAALTLEYQTRKMQEDYLSTQSSIARQYHEAHNDLQLEVSRLANGQEHAGVQ